MRVDERRRWRQVDGYATPPVPWLTVGLLWLQSAPASGLFSDLMFLSDVVTFVLVLKGTCQKPRTFHRSLHFCSINSFPPLPRN